MSLNDRIPAEGLILSEGREQLVFAPYQCRDGKILVDGRDRTELLDAETCYLFDRDTEYRRVYRRARNDVIETVLTAREEKEMDPELIYREEVLVKPEYTALPGIPKTLIIVNRYRYSKGDTLVLDDFRVGLK